MNHLSIYLSALFLRRLVAVGFGVVALVSLLDSLGSRDLLPEGAGLVAQARFAFLRLPMILDATFPIILLLAIIATYLSLIRRNEIVSLQAFGVSVFGQVRKLAPCLFLVGLSGTAIISATSPPAAHSLTQWLGADVLNAERGDDPYVWVSEPDALVRIGTVSDRRLHDLTFFNRSDGGQVVSVMKADIATYDQGRWQLSRARRLNAGPTAPMAPDVWSTPQTPESLFKFQIYPRFLSFPDLWQLYQLRGSGSRPSSAYLVWLLDRLLLPVLAIGLLLLAAPLLQCAGRRDTGELSALVAIGIGFVYLIGDGILTTLAETGILNGWVGAVAPLATLLLSGTWLALRNERAQ